MPPAECPGGACIVIRKFYDWDADGLRVGREPMLAGIPFEIVMGGKSFRATTDAFGVIRLCFPDPTEVEVHELLRETGGLWTTTTGNRAVWRLACGDNVAWVGNARIRAPRTGERGAHRDWHAGGGDQRYF